MSIETPENRPINSKKEDTTISAEEIAERRHRVAVEGNVAARFAAAFAIRPDFDRLFPPLAITRDIDARTITTTEPKIKAGLEIYGEIFAMRETRETTNKALKD